MKMIKAGDNLNRLLGLPEETTAVKVYAVDDDMVYLHYNFIPKNGCTWYHEFKMRKEIWADDNKAREILNKEIQYWIDYANKQIDEGKVK